MIGRKMLRKELQKEIALYSGKLESPDTYSNLLPDVDSKRQSE
jgi:hypothetical protein